MKLISVFIIALASLASSNVQAQASSSPNPDTAVNAGWATVRYDGVPIKITIQANQESTLRFPWRVRLGLPSEMLSAIEVVSAGDTSFITPLMAFKETRFVAEDQATGAVMFIDITASVDGEPRRLNFIDNRRNIAASLSPGAEPSSTTSTPFNQQRNDVGGEEFSYAVLSRLAYQSTFSEERAIDRLEGVNEAPIQEPLSINNLVPGHNILATPITQWRTGSGLFMTSVHLRNRDPQVVSLDVRTFRHTTSWLASSFWSTQLAPSGTFGRDETVMVVISTTSWNSTIDQEGVLLSNVNGLRGE